MSSFTSQVPSSIKTSHLSSSPSLRLIFTFCAMSKTASSKSGKTPAKAPTAQQVMSQEELRSLSANDGSSSSNAGIHPGTNGDLDEDDIDPKDENDGEREDNPANYSGTYSASVANSIHNVAPAHTTIIKYGGGGGLFGDTSIPSTITAMPKLTGPSAHQYNDWKLKATNYFSTNGLAEVATMEPISSLELAITIDGGAENQRPN